ncbi:MAG: uracil-DNA glycosylase [Zetaproteobacteria bacterium CG12_big_fil_rev_8_21_14_0_65_54_13]|nr:MAG: uracil-DNA glycosylase [Zetaproteobacteria bacterium CG12_big_fil_rev_8_21_14_0_65_54_13]PIX55128.1 MAG: uracil-DNA glycosylase [Zetaproteobacteria bacterium CG_4_10_14_3_um_filter_54_28]PJA30002.1 MAG: uracil-DNA glycosylase [Zetaproteobacteria bacterium CG_4_9_14_3_um_filter_54_145]
MAEQPDQSRPAQCRTCRNYFVTWDKARPHGCRAFNFKSPRLPCFDVQSASHMLCQNYQAKQANSG